MICSIFICVYCVIGWNVCFSMNSRWQTQSAWDFVPTRSVFVTPKTVAKDALDEKMNQNVLGSIISSWNQTFDGSNQSVAKNEVLPRTTLLPFLPFFQQESSEANTSSEARKKHKFKKKLKKFMLPLLLAYKLKFFTLIPVMIGGLILLSGSTGLAGFFFALFAAVMGLKAGSHGH